MSQIHIFNCNNQENLLTTNNQETGSQPQTREWIVAAYSWAVKAQVNEALVLFYIKNFKSNTVFKVVFLKIGSIV